MLLPVMRLLLGSRSSRTEYETIFAVPASQRANAVLADLFHVADPSEARGNTITAREILDKVRMGCWVTDGEGYASNDE